MNTSTAPGQSQFVTVLAWILLVFGALGVFVSLMQNVMINLIFPSMAAGNASHGAQQPFPITSFRIFGLLMLCFMLFMTYSAYALLKRRNWARRLYVVLFAIGIAWSVVFAVAGSYAGWIGFPRPVQSAGMPSGTDSMLKVVMVMFWIFAVVQSALYAWLIRRLRSASVKSEFYAPVRGMD